MGLEAINPAGWKRAPGWAHGFLLRQAEGTMVKTAGQVGWDMNELKMVSTHLPEQYDRALLNICTIVKEAGGQPTDIYDLHIYVTNMDEFRKYQEEMTQTYRKRLGKHFPAMTLLGVKELFEKDVKIEVEAAAFIHLEKNDD